MKIGSKLKSAVCQAEFIVIKSVKGGNLSCGGQPLSEAADSTSGDPDLMNGSLIGKRYVNAASTIELLCTKSGEGSLHYNGEELFVQDTRQLPSSD